MEPRTKLRDESNADRAVSPTIGVVLMFAITVLLAAVIGAFVLELGQSAGETVPQASLSVNVDPTTENVTIEHTGGDGLADSDTRILVTNESTGTTQTFDTGGSDDVFRVGQQLELNVSSGSMAGSDVFTARTGSPTLGGISSGTQYTITVIDTEFQRQIFETTITA